jgi:DNA-binding response OmpR family regulator
MSAIEFAAAPVRPGDTVASTAPEPPLLLWVRERLNQPTVDGTAASIPGFRLLQADDVSTGATVMQQRCPDVVVIELSSGGRGASLLADWPGSPAVPVIVVAATEDADAVSALELGADDFMVKPVTPAELVARARAAIRRARATRPSAPPRQSALTLNRELREVRADGRRVRLSPLDFRMLEYLARSPGQTFSVDHLLEAVWGSDPAWTTATVRQHIEDLRTTLRTGGLEHLPITAVSGPGYRFDG